MYVLDVLVLPAAEIKRLFYAIRFVFPDENSGTPSCSRSNEQKDGVPLSKTLCILPALIVQPIGLKYT